MLEKIKMAKKTRNFYKVENYMSDPSKKRPQNQRIAKFGAEFDKAIRTSQDNYEGSDNDEIDGQSVELPTTKPLREKVNIKQSNLFNINKYEKKTYQSF